jgi:hypothetical protein
MAAEKSKIEIDKNAIVAPKTMERRTDVRSSNSQVSACANRTIISSYVLFA